MCHQRERCSPRFGDLSRWRTTYIGLPRYLRIRFHEFLSGRVQVISKIEAPLDGASGLTVSPDRKTFLYSIVVHPESDLMLIENFR